jgi:nucleoside-diphosphate-sugar epimerase
VNLLVIGGTRFIGPAVVARLCADGHVVTVMHRGSCAARLPAGAHELGGDRNRPEDVTRALAVSAAEVLIDMVLHSAEQATQLLAAALGRARRLVVASSLDVYRAYERLAGDATGPPDPVPLDEDAPLRESAFPRRKLALGPSDWRYDYDKLQVERVLAGEARLPATVLRLPYVYGPGDYRHRTWPHLSRMDRGLPLVLSPLEAAWRASRAYVQNVAEVFALCVAREAAAGRTYNVADEPTLSEREWIAAIGRAAGWSGELELAAEPPSGAPPATGRRGHFAQHFELDAGRVRAELCYRQPVGLAQALAQTVRWQRAHPPEGGEPGD